MPVTPPPYEELEGSPEEEWTDDGGFRAARTLKTAWTNRATLVLYLRGGNTGSEIITAQDYPHQAGVKCVSASARPFFNEEVVAHGGTNTNVASYRFAEVRANYGVTTRDGGSGTNSAGEIVFESLEPVSEFLTLPADGFRWGATNGKPLKDDEAPGKQFRSLNYVYKRTGVATLPPETFSLIGKVNSGTITAITLGQAFAAETLLYNPPLLERQVAADGTGLWSITYRFQYRPQGFNRFWRQDTQAWDRIFNAAGPADPYETGDFTPLIG